MGNNKSYVKRKYSNLLNTDFSFKSLFEVAHDHDGRVFYEFTHHYKRFTYTYAETKEYCYKMATYLSLHLTEDKGSFVGIHMENSLNWIGCFWGLLIAGYKPMLLNCKLPLLMNLEIVDELKIKTVITTNDLFDSCENLKVVKLNQGLKPYDKVLEQELFGNESWADNIALSTTATTQNYKICIYSGSDIIYQVLNTGKIVKENPTIISCDDQIRHLCFLPLYHVFGLVATYLWFSLFGSSFVFLPDYSSETILKTIRRHEVTHIFAVPLLWNTITKEVRKSVALLSEKEQLKFEKGLMLSHKIQNICPRYGMKLAKKLFERVTDQTLGDSIKFMISGGGYISQDALYLLNGIGYPLYNGYGSTEVGISSVELRLKAKYRTSGSIGEPFESVEYLIDNGELKIKGKSMCSYIIPRGKTLYEINKDDWFCSNDNASVDKNGNFYILGRADDVVIDSTGEKINPDVIEKEVKLKSVNNFCITDYENELSFIFEISCKTNPLKMKTIFEEVKEEVKKLNNRGYKIVKIYYTTDSMVNKNAIKVSRRILKNKLDSGEVRLHTLDEIINCNNENSNVEVSDTVLNIVKDQFADVLGINSSEIEPSKHFILELGGSSLDYATLTTKIKSEFDVELDFDSNIFSTVLEFSLYISEKLNGGSKNEEV